MTDKLTMDMMKKLKEKKIHVNSKTMQMSIVLPKIKSAKRTLRFANDLFDAKVILRRKNGS